MPAKKIIEDVTSTLAVMGSNMATATAGPMPGSTPTAVPSRQPTKAHIKFAGVIAVAKPCSSALRMSISNPPCAGQSRQVDAQELSEGPKDRCGNGGTRDCVDDQNARVTGVLPASASQSLHGQHVAKRAAEDEADGGD